MDVACPFCLNESPCIAPLPAPPVQPHSLHWSHISSGTEVDQAKEYLKQDIARLDRVEAILRAGEAEKAVIVARINERRASISAMRQIPAEIWREIFLLVCFSDGKYSCTVGPSSDRSSRFTDKVTITSLPQLTLSTVCSRWRSIIFDYPRIWSRLYVELFGSLNLEKIEPSVGLCLRNSKAHVLKLTIALRKIVRPRRRESDIALAMFVFKTLALEFYRCEELELTGHFESSTPIRCGASGAETAMSFPVLRRVRINGPTASQGHSWFWEALSHAPSLASAILKYLPTSEMLPLKTLTHLEVLDDDSPHTLFAILPHLGNLQVLKVKLYTLSEPTVQTNSIVLPSLLSLDLEVRLGNDTNTLYTLFQKFIFSNLWSLCLRCPGGLLTDSETWWYPAFRSAFQRSTISAETLTLSFTNTEFALPTFPIAGLLSCTPNVSRLSISAERTIDWTGRYHPEDHVLAVHIPIIHLFETLTTSESETDTTLVPALKSLSMRLGLPWVSARALTTAEALLAMVSSRCAPTRDSDNDRSSTLSEFQFIYESPELRSVLTEPSFHARLEAAMHGVTRRAAEHATSW
ncbi:hypothetical protein PM082_010253 [Marasmius tenuissimus]|nr:hypothetical protein PM082_010253 [Marasmius tenuissimus]